MEILEDEEGGMGEVAAALRKIAVAVKYAGSGDNADSRGAIEVLSISVKEGLEDLSRSVRDHGRTVGAALDNCADAMRELGEGVKAEAKSVGNHGLQDVATALHGLAGDVRAAMGKDGMGVVAEAISEVMELVTTHNQGEATGAGDGKPTCQEVDAAVEAAGGGGVKSSEVEP